MINLEIEIKKMKKELLKFSNDMKKLQKLDNKSKKHLNKLNK
jgi:hypothetical protein